MADLEQKAVNNVAIERDGNNLVLSIDMSSFLNKQLNASMLAQSGKTYRVASIGGGGFYLKMQDELEGVLLKLDVVVSKKRYEDKLTKQEQQDIARVAYSELSKIDQEKGLLKALGLNPELLAEAISIAKTKQQQIAR